MSGQGHDAFLSRDADMGGIHTRFETEFVDHGLTQGFVVHCAFLTRSVAVLGSAEEGAG
jgi:hypothetical protein